MNTVAIVLAILAIVVFLAAAIKDLARSWMIPLGLALFAASYLLAAWAPWTPQHF